MVWRVKGVVAMNQKWIVLLFLEWWAKVEILSISVLDKWHRSSLIYLCIVKLVCMVLSLWELELATGAEVRSADCDIISMVELSMWCTIVWGSMIVVSTIVVSFWTVLMTRLSLGNTAAEVLTTAGDWPFLCSVTSTLPSNLRKLLRPSYSSWYFM